ncbi:MAG TPA: hypothetical protein PKD63_05610 [Solirubrobacteraceae bacterium]|nr:hypothetical protein [Solirubrobacteraceae bacterium]
MSRARVIDLTLMLGAFLAGTLLAELLGASNSGTAMTFGQMTFAVSLVFVLLRR